jgi:K+-sensing histidine kinase KdpD
VIDAPFPTRQSSSPPLPGMRVTTANTALRLTIGAGLGSAIALIASYGAFRFRSNLPTAGFIDLLIVVVIALKFGFREATACSLVAVACLDYFFAPPIHSFHIADPKKWVAPGHLRNYRPDCESSFGSTAKGDQGIAASPQEC